MTLSIGGRATKLQQKLLDIRAGSGAVRLPHNVKRLNLRFAQKAEGGHLGARKLWRNELIRLKYHNPAVPITIDRQVQQSEPALLSIHFTDDDAPQTSASETSSPAPINSTTSTSTPTEAAPTTRVETIDVTGKRNDEILAALVDATKATVLESSADDESLRLDLQAKFRRNAAQSAISQELKRKARREAEIVARAREALN